MSNRNIFLNVCLVTLIFLASLIAIYIFSMSLFILKNKDAKYYLFGNDKIPSIYKVNGKRNLYFYRSTEKDNNEVKIFKYKDVEDVKSDLSNYINELKDTYNYVYTTELDLNNYNDTFELSANSVDDGKIIIINISYTEDRYVIKITKGKGNLNFYDN